MALPARTEDWLLDGKSALSTNLDFILFFSTD